jgi:hypothetical protein
MEPDWRESLRTRRTFNGRLRIHTKADTYRHYEIRVVPIERGGKLAEWIGACTDATSQQEAEAQQIRLTDQLSAAAQRTARLQQATSMLAEALDLEQVVEVITEVGRTSRRLGIAAPTIGRHFTHAGELKMPVVQRAFARLRPGPRRRQRRR